MPYSLRSFFQKFSGRTLMIVAFAIAALLRALLFYFMVRKGIDPAPGGDSLEYRMLGLNLLRGNGFVMEQHLPFLHELLRTPGYPVFLALTYLFDQRSYLAMGIQLALSWYIGYLLYRSLLKIVRPGVALAAAVTWLFLPLELFWSLPTRTEITFTFVVFVLFLFILKKHRSFALAMATGGFLFAISAYIKPSATLFLPGFLAAIYLLHQPLKQRLTGMLIFVLVFTAMLIPWAVRNYSLTNHLLFSSSGAYNQLIGFNQPFTGEQYDQLHISTPLVDSKGRAGARYWIYSVEGYPTLLSLIQRHARDHSLFDIGLEQIVCAKTVWYPGGLHVSLVPFGIDELKPTLFNRIQWSLDAILSSVLLVLALLGAWWGWKKDLRPIIACSVLVILTNTFINLCVSSSRIGLPTWPWLLILSACGVQALLEKYPVLLRSLRGLRRKA